MATGRNPSRENEKKDGAFFLFGMIAVMIVGFSFIFWNAAGDKVVQHVLTPVLAMGKLWKLVGPEGSGTYLGLMDQAIAMARAPKAVGLTDWVNFYNVSMQPFSALVALPLLALTGWLAWRKKNAGILRRKFSAESLMDEHAKNFTGILPVIKIRKDIVTDKNPLWRRQVAPEEIFLHYKSESGKPMSTKDVFHDDVAREYFTQLTRDKKTGRILSSKMLGRLVVDVVNDARNYKNIVFPDRFSSEGKVLFAMFVAVAFGGADGRKDYDKYRDLLNRSAYGSKNGMANLTVAQPLYTKYRNNEKARMLFGVHHWEYTYLFSLLEMAQRKGRFTTAELLWLRPMNRVLFFALNTRGAFTPHTEAAAVFSQYEYERRLAMEKRIPVKDGQPIIFSDNAIEGLRKEWAHWMESTDDEDVDFWAADKRHMRRLFNAAESTALENLNSPPPPPPAALRENTAFDEGFADQKQP